VVVAGSGVLSMIPTSWLGFLGPDSLCFTLFGKVVVPKIAVAVKGFILCDLPWSGRLYGRFLLLSRDVFGVETIIHHFILNVIRIHLHYGVILKCYCMA